MLNIAVPIWELVLRSAVVSLPVIIHNGRVFDDVMREAKLTHHDLHSALRQNGCGCVEEVQTAIPENNGSVSVVTRATRRTSSGVESVQATGRMSRDRRPSYERPRRLIPSNAAVL
jgi:uncharacterized membrane protein YcaP (DUF421 family)